MTKPTNQIANKTLNEIAINFNKRDDEFVTSRREMIHYRQEENPFVKILWTQNEYRLESNILLLRQKLIFCVIWIIFQQFIFLLEQEEIILTAKSRLFTLWAKGFHLPQVDLSDCTIYVIKKILDQKYRMLYFDELFFITL